MIRKCAYVPYNHLNNKKHLKAFTVADLFCDDPILKASNMDQNLANLKQKLCTNQAMLSPCSNGPAYHSRLQLHRATGYIAAKNAQ